MTGRKIATIGRVMGIGRATVYRAERVRGPRRRSGRYTVARPILSTRQMVATFRPVIAWTRRTNAAFF